MLIRDIKPSQKIKKIAAEEILGMKPYKDKRSRYFHLSLRAVFLCVLIFTVLPLFSSEASEDGVLEAAQESIQEISSSVEEGISSGLEGIAASLEAISSGLGELLGLEEEIAEENFETLPVEGVADVGAQASIPVQSAPPAAIARMTMLEKAAAGGKERFVTRTPAGDEAGFFDADETSEVPYLRLDKWSGETKLKIKLPQAEKGSKKLENDKLKVKGGRYAVEVYPRSSQEITEDIAGVPYTFTIDNEGGVEFDIVLESIPESNVFEFPIEGEGLRFYYQPALHAEHPTWADEDGDGVADNFRPEMVVGSYAVYYEAKESFFKEKEKEAKYKTGKVFHIYRPKVTDAAGSEIWGELFFDEITQVLKVTVDAAWLANASYPVRVDPNLGYSTAGASSTRLTDQIRSTFPVAASADGIAMELYAYMRAAGIAYAAKGTIYNSSRAPLNTGGSMGMTTFTTAMWYSDVFMGAPSIASGSTYYATVWVDNATYLYYDTASSTTILSQARTYGLSWPNPASTASSTYKYSIYATYGSSGGSRAPGVGISGGGMLMF